MSRFLIKWIWSCETEKTERENKVLWEERLEKKNEEMTDKKRKKKKRMWTVKLNAIQIM